MPTARVREERSKARTRLIMSCSSKRICFAHSAARRPFSFRWTRFFARSNSLTPSKSSSFCMERVRDGWVRCSFSEAADRVPQSKTAHNCSSKYVSIMFSSSTIRFTYGLIRQKHCTFLQSSAKILYVSELSLFGMEGDSDENTGRLFYLERQHQGDCRADCTKDAWKTVPD